MMEVEIDWDNLINENGQEENKSDNEQQPKAGGPPEGVDPFVWALSVVAERAKQDPQTAELVRTAVGVPQQPQPQSQPQTQPQASEDAKRLEAIKAEQEEIKRKLMTTEAGSDEYNRLMLRLQELEADRIVLEPKVAIESQIGPIRQAQINTVLMQLMQSVQQRVYNTQPFAALNDAQKNALVANTQRVLGELAKRQPDALLSGNAMATVEYILRSLYFEVATPAAPYDPQAGANPAGGGDDITSVLKQKAEEFGVDPKLLAEEFKRIMEGNDGW